MCNALVQFAQPVVNRFLSRKYSIRTKETLSDPKSGCRDQVVADTAKNEKLENFNNKTQSFLKVKDSFGQQIFFCCYSFVASESSFFVRHSGVLFLFL
ncbi:hypothetical protein RIR_jg2770.t1 [Rhizophagus irregularis DAOM 181602=DAOM 197198]|nr:hypothetical protein RIR_jg2770.t1 [Rhizophagus irregularis DAOM 181602=DAOM 197198]